MNDVDDMLKLSGVEMAESDEDYYGSLQRQIDSGVIWRMEGTVGRGAMAAIEAGKVMLGEQRRKDFWGSLVPSRDDVKPGTKGSRAFVVEREGEEWAKMLEKAEAS